LARQATVFGLQGEVVPNVNAAFRLAKEKATTRDMIFIGGSTFVVAELENL
jgi:dihydrofolate synthase/folylpolyglutamate synthase